MQYIFMAHRIVGSLMLPLLLLLAAIWFTATWKPDRWPARPALVLRVLIALQFVLGLIYWLFQVFAGGAAYYLAFPFLVHPIVGVIAMIVAQWLLRPHALGARLGRWRPLLSLGSIMLLVLAATVIVTMV